MGKYVIVRGDRAACFAGQLVSQDGQTVTLTEARRLWYWDGAATLSELAVHGTAKPKQCKFPASVPEIVVFGVVEMITATEQARENIEAVPVWSAR